MERLADRMTSLETVVHHALHLGFQAPVQMKSPTAEAVPVRKTSKKKRAGTQPSMSALPTPQAAAPALASSTRTAGTPPMASSNSLAGDNAGWTPPAASSNSSWAITRGHDQVSSASPST